jgi:hypothetical protein
LLALVVVFVASACSDPNSGSSSHLSSSDGAESFDASRQAFVYAAIIRQLVTKDAGFGGAP